MPKNGSHVYNRLDRGKLIGMFDRIFHSERYLGARKRDYFEGWYFKAGGTFPFAYIAGVSKAKSDPHCFIQYADRVRSVRRRFPLSDFSFIKKDMTVRVADNTFSLNGIQARLTAENEAVETAVKFSGAALYQKSLLAPSVMGPFSYLPMPCSHAVVSLRHTVCGTHTVCGEPHLIDGCGYIEKDYGKSFPQNYVWAQGFSGGTSIMTAVAWPLPLVKRGFLCLISHDGVQHNLSLYTGAKLTAFEPFGNGARFTIKKRDCMVDFTVQSASSVRLSAPEKGGIMSAVIGESLCAAANIRLVLNGRAIPLPPLIPVTFESVTRDDTSFGHFDKN